MSKLRPLGEVSLQGLVAIAKANLARHEKDCLTCSVGLKTCPIAKKLRKQINDFAKLKIR